MIKLNGLQKSFATFFNKTVPVLNNACRTISSTSTLYVKSKSPGLLLSKKLEEDDSGDSLYFHIYEENLKHYENLKTQYKKLEEKALEGGGEKGIKRHVERNKKVLVRERIKAILDEDSPILEIGMFAGFNLPYGDVPCAGSVCIIGKIHGIWCIFGANDATVKSGSIYPITLRKQLRCQEIGHANFLPTIFLVDSGGAFLPLQADIFNLGGKSFYNEAVFGASGVPQIALVCGSCTAGGAYVPAMADEAVIVDKIGTIFLGGPPLVRAATGERVTPEQLGGATLHCNISGVTDHFAATEQEGFKMIRDIVLTLNILPDMNLQISRNFDMGEATKSLNKFTSKSIYHNLNVKNILANLADGSKFHEFKRTYGSSLACGFMFVNGYLTGVIANNGYLSAKAAIKASHFIQLCDDRQLPILFLQNQTFDDFSVNERLSHNDEVVKGRAKMMQAMATTNVPKFIISIGGIVGSSDNYGMCSLAFDARFHFVWPNVKFSPMEQSNLECAIASYSNKAALDKEEIIELQNQTGVFYGASRLWCDNVILPENTKQVITTCLDIFRQERMVRLHKTINSSNKQTVYRM